SKIGGKTHIPIESIRLKLLREGMEDYEYMNLLKNLGDASFAQAQVARVASNTYTWTKAPILLYDAREKMAAQIVTHIDAGEGVPNPLSDPEAPNDPVVASNPGSSSIEGAVPPNTAGPVDLPNNVPGSGAPSAGGGGCSIAMSATKSPLSLTEGLSSLLLLFAPFGARLYRKIRSHLSGLG
ncbi:MAG: DUF4091 domain-containing protein, partial [Nitrospirae bacterium]|nr:DUF4091 domain-containing protein [Candidatus Manganitrophaceae bacterium]